MSRIKIYDEITQSWVYADQGMGVTIDGTLTHGGEAADAGVTGNKIIDLSNKVILNDQKQTEAVNKKVSLPDSGNGIIGQVALSDSKGGVTWGNLDVYEFKDLNNDGNITISIKK